VSVKADGQAFVDRTPVTIDSIVTMVENTREGRPIMIKADEQARFKDVRVIMDKLHELPGTDTMLLATAKKKE
jgi:biopolymer transport protein ExbD